MKFNTTLIVLVVLDITLVVGMVEGSGYSLSALQPTTKHTPVIPHVYQYVILTIFAIVGGALLANAYLTRVLKTIASELESKKAIRKFGWNTFFRVIPVVYILYYTWYGFFLLHYLKVLYGFYLIIFNAILAGLMFLSWKKPYIWITDKEIVIFKPILRNPKIISKNTIQDIMFKKTDSVVLSIKDKKEKLKLSTLKKADRDEVILILSREFL